MKAERMNETKTKRVVLINQQKKGEKRKQRRKKGETKNKEEKKEEAEYKIKRQRGTQTTSV
jgi:hypothetical protein